MRRLTAVLLLTLASGCGDERKEMLTQRRHKIDHVRAMVGLLAAKKTLPIKDGALDIYALVRSGEIPKTDYAILRRWPEEVPSDYEIEHGDYTHFPYERYRGRAELDGRYPIPLIWDAEPDSAGILIVGMSDGAVRTMYRSEFLREFGG